MDEEAKLLVVSHGKDEDGYSVENKKEYPVYVSEKSVSRTEFYKALSEHINLKMILELRQEDWNQTEHIVNGKKEYATRIEYDGCIYDIVRSYRNDRSMIELSCS